MKFLDLTLSTPEQNLACDEALLDACEAGQGEEVLRFWEPRQYFIVLGYANRMRAEVIVPAWQASGMPLMRRCSGGGTVLQGPGCLNYALVLRLEEAGPTGSIAQTNAYIMTRHQAALRPVLGDSVTVQGLTDLALGDRKFSGNAQRRKRRYLLFHGSFLLHFELQLIEALLALPPKQPAYRQNRAHRDFLTNLHVPAQLIKDTLRRHWQATDEFCAVPWDHINRLVQEKYASQAWNLHMPFHPLAIGSLG
jgi:lipoate-protein ligase A